MKFFCDACGQRLEVADEYIGQVTSCPSCNSGVTIPAVTPDTEEMEQVVKESMESTPAGMTIAQFMADRDLDGGVTLETKDVLEEDQNVKYSYGKLIAQGGMGAILEAGDLNVKRNVAMKVLLEPDSATNADILRFIEEAQVTGQLEHPSVVPVHDLGVDGSGKVFYTMKLVKGLTLHAILRKILEGDEDTVREYPLVGLLTIFQKVCDAIAFAHSKNVIHRDLKPENIMVGEFGEVLVMDWGLAKVLGRASSDPYASEEQIQSVRNQDAGEALVTIAGTIFGTPQFMAPEQATGETAAMDQRTDIYSLGAILYNILSLRPPVEGDTVHDVLNKVTRGDIETPTVYNTQKGAKRVTGVPGLPVEARLRHCPNEKIPDALAAVTMKAMATKPGLRYRSVQELQDDIQAYQGGFATSAEQAGALKLLSLFIKRNKLATASALVISVLGIGFIGNALANARAVQLVSREAAPEFVSKARIAIEENRDEDAKKALKTALGLHAELDDAWFETARIRLAEFDFDGALEALKKVPDDPRATPLVEFAEKWDEKTRGDGVLTEDIPVLAAEIEPIDPVIAGRLFSQLGDKKKALRIRVQSAFAKIEELNPGFKILEGGPFPLAWHHVITAHGLQFDFHHFDRERLVNISPLAGLPIRSLKFFTHPVHDITALQGMPLRELDLYGTKIAGLQPLRGMPLEKLGLHSTAVTDLGPLQGLPLQELNLTSTKVTDLGPLSDSPLENLNLGGCRELNDLEPLRGLPLKTLIIDQADKISDLSPLEGMPLERFEAKSNAGIVDLSPLKDAPLKRVALGTRSSDLSFLKGKRLDYLQLGLVPVEDWSFLNEVSVRELTIRDETFEGLTADGVRLSSELERVTLTGNFHTADLLRGLPQLRNATLESSLLEDLSALEGMQLEEITLKNARIENLDSLRGMPLTSLTINHLVELGGIRAIAGMPLKTLSLLRCDKLRDYSPLRELDQLEVLTLPESAKVIDLDFLRSFPKLKQIGYGSPRPVAEFWREVDAR